MTGNTGKCLQCFEVILSPLSKIAFCRLWITRAKATESDNTRDKDGVYAKDDANHSQASTTWSSPFSLFPSHLPPPAFYLIVSVSVTWLKLVTWIDQDLKLCSICKIICIKHSWNVWEQRIQTRQFAVPKTQLYPINSCRSNSTQVNWHCQL